MPYTPITDIAAANTAIAELYGQTDALIRRVGGLTLAELGGLPLTGGQVTGTLSLSKDQAYLYLIRPAGGSAPLQGVVFQDIGTWKNFLGCRLSDGAIVSGINADRIMMHADITYPVGSNLRISGRSTNPATLLGFGTWTQVRADNERICVGSQVIHDGFSGSGSAGKTELVGCYNYSLIDVVFRGTATPTGYHREYRLSTQYYTGGSGTLRLYLNNQATETGGTWSTPAFRGYMSSGLFKETDITLIYPVVGFGGNQGTSLFYESSVAGAWQFWHPTVHGYLVSDDIRYEWKRTA